MTERDEEEAVATPEETEASGWIIREISFATFRTEHEINAQKLEASLSLLEKGVANWNNYRDSHPQFQPYLRNTNLSWTNKHLPDLSGINLSGAMLQDTDFTGQALYGADLSGASLQRAVLVDVGLSEAVLDMADLSWAELTEAHLDFASFDLANLTGANLTDAEMWNASLQGADLHLATLDYAEASSVLAMDANLSMARMLQTDLSGADLSRADLSYALLVGTNLRDADLQGAHVYGSSAWDITDEGANQLGLVITQEYDAPILVDDLEVAQFVYMILNHKKLRKAIGAVAERGVLLLGRFKDGGYELLQAVAARLRELKYLPIIFDFDRPDDRNYTETVKTLAGLARFVVVDLSGPSVPQELTATVPHFKIPYVLIIERGRQPYSMIKDLLEYPWVIHPIVEFGNAQELSELLAEKVVRPAEERLVERQKLLKELFEEE